MQLDDGYREEWLALVSHRIRYNLSLFQVKFKVQRTDPVTTFISLNTTLTKMALPRAHLLGCLNLMDFHSTINTI